MINARVVRITTIGCTVGLRPTKGTGAKLLASPTNAIVGCITTLGGAVSLVDARVESTNLPALAVETVVGRITTIAVTVFRYEAVCIRANQRTITIKAMEVA